MYISLCTFHAAVRVIRTDTYWITTLVSSETQTMYADHVSTAGVYTFTSRSDPAVWILHMWIVDTRPFDRSGGYSHSSTITHSLNHTTLNGRIRHTTNGMGPRCHPAIPAVYVHPPLHHYPHHPKKQHRGLWVVPCPKLNNRPQMCCMHIWHTRLRGRCIVPHNHRNKRAVTVVASEPVRANDTEASATATHETIK